jgi:hypothetical protein
MREPPPPPPPPPSGTILGHGDYRTRTGAHGACEGLSIALMHETPDFRQRIVSLYGSDSARLLASTVKARSARLGPAPQPPLAASVTCDASNSFAFRDVSPGPYFIIARVNVTATTGAVQDVVVLRHLFVSEGQTQTISLGP